MNNIYFSGSNKDRLKCLILKEGNLRYIKDFRKTFRSK